MPDIFLVKAWVSDPEPFWDERIVAFGSLIKYKHYLGGIMMTATWPDASIDRGVPNCLTQVTYGSGKCVIDVSRYPPGIYVPITVTFTYEGWIFNAYTGFTPHEP